MSVLTHDIELVGTLGRMRRTALFDSGSSYSMIRRDIAEQLEPLNLLPDPENWVFETARVGELIKARYRVTLDFIFRDSTARFSDEFIVFEDCSEEVIVGAATLQKWHIILDFEREEVVYRKTAERMRRA